MKSFDYIITDAQGIHARPAGMLAKLAKSYEGTVITVTKGAKTVKASQLMMLMSLGVKKGESITIAAEGGDETAAIEGMMRFMEENL